MKAFFDFGNSFLAWAIREDTNWTTGKIEAQPEDTLPDRLAECFKNISTPEQVWIASVVDQPAIDNLRKWVKLQWHTDLRVIQATDHAYGITNSYSDVTTLGSDRWSAMVAVSNRYALPACVVDCGTALTIDTLDSEGHHLGGVIFPGIKLLRKGLIENTDQLSIEIGDGLQCLANSTSSGILSGTMIGLTGAIEKIVQCQRKAVETELNIYLCGGDSLEVSNKLNMDFQIVDDLVLQGLEVISELES